MIEGGLQIWLQSLFEIESEEDMLKLPMIFADGMVLQANAYLMEPRNSWK